LQKANISAAKSSAASYKKLRFELQKARIPDGEHTLQDAESK
jgi:hypothetical protein